jgi:hypothetical protein
VGPVVRVDADAARGHFCFIPASTGNVAPVTYRASSEARNSSAAPFADRGAITRGYAGVYSSLLLHAERAAQRYGVQAHEILQRVDEAGYVGGQEDMIIDIALQFDVERDRAAV